jgi:sodium-dependent phosphate cotransporter
MDSPIKAIVAPIADRIIKANSKVIEEIAIGIHENCDAYYPTVCVDGVENYQNCAAKCPEGGVVGVDCGRVGTITCSKTYGCSAFFQNGATQAEDAVSGGVCLFLSIVMLIVCLVGLVNVLQRGLNGMSTRIIYKATNVNGLLAMIIGCGITVCEYTDVLLA